MGKKSNFQQSSFPLKVWLIKSTFKFKCMSAFKAKSIHKNVMWNGLFAKLMTMQSMGCLLNTIRVNYRQRNRLLFVLFCFFYFLNEMGMKLSSENALQVKASDLPRQRVSVFLEIVSIFLKYHLWVTFPFCVISHKCTFQVPTTEASPEFLNSKNS